MKFQACKISLQLKQLADQLQKRPIVRLFLVTATPNISPIYLFLRRYDIKPSNPPSATSNPPIPPPINPTISSTIPHTSAAQGEQQSYSSGWMSLPSGSYNFTFGTIGVGSLEVDVTVISKGRVW